jgi:hypothetical protein
MKISLPNKEGRRIIDKEYLVKLNNQIFTINYQNIISGLFMQ